MNLDSTSRRDVLKLSAGGLAALAGCSTSSEVPEDPNPYDYTFVEGRDIADDIPDHKGEDVRTKTQLGSGVEYIKEHTHGYGRVYTADPPETVQNFPIYEKMEGTDREPLRNALGEAFHDGSYTDIDLEVYGSVERVVDDGPEVMDTWGLVVHDAVRTANSQTTPSTNGTTTGDGA